MKKLTLIILVLFYGLSSSGMTINLHFCCGKLDGISFNERQHEQDCPMGKNMGDVPCCHDEQVSAKVNADQQQGTQYFHIQQDIVAATHAFSLYTPHAPPSFLINERVVNYPFSPPVPAYILQGVFRI